MIMTPEAPVAPAPVLVLGDTVLDVSVRVHDKRVHSVINKVPHYSVVRANLGDTSSTVPRITFDLGGAGNVLRGLKAVKVPVAFLGVCDSEQSRTEPSRSVFDQVEARRCRADAVLRAALEGVPNCFAHMPGHEMPKRTRLYRSNGELVCRVDDDPPLSVAGEPPPQLTTLTGWFSAHMSTGEPPIEPFAPPRVVVFSLYGKGFSRLFRTDCYENWRTGWIPPHTPVIVDTKELRDVFALAGKNVIFKLDQATAARFLRELLTGKEQPHGYALPWDERGVELLTALVRVLRFEEVRFRALWITTEWWGGVAWVSGGEGGGDLVTLPTWTCTAPCASCGSGDAAVAALASLLYDTESKATLTQQLKLATYAATYATQRPFVASLLQEDLDAARHRGGL